MSPRNLRLLLAAATPVVVALALAPEALAAAGGGSAGFGGGGFHGGGGGGSGRGFALYLLLQLLFRIALIGHGLGLLVILGLIVMAYLYRVVTPRTRAAWEARREQGHAARRTTARRERRVELAAAEAAEDDPLFAPDLVRAAATTLFGDVQSAWDTRDRARLAQLVAPELLAEWERRLDDFDRRGWHNRVQPLEPPGIEYVALHNASDPTRKRVVVRVEARMRDYVEDAAGNHIKRLGRATETVRTREFWTLGRSPDAQRWVLYSIERGAEGSHALSERLVASPWSDEEALRDEALVEQAMQEAPPPDVRPGELVNLDYGADARAAALDLSVADGRFSPDVLEVAVRRAVSAWAEAVDGSERALHALAMPGAADELLHPGDPAKRTRVVVRGPRVEAIRITALDPTAQPPTMSVEVEIRGRRYIEERGTTRLVSGSPSQETQFSEHWTFALVDEPSSPWRIAGVGAAPLARR